MNFDRLRFVAERAELGEGNEALLSIDIPERPGRQAFCIFLCSLPNFRCAVSSPYTPRYIHALSRSSFTVIIATVLQIGRMLSYLSKYNSGPELQKSPHSCQLSPNMTWQALTLVITKWLKVMRGT